MRRGNNHAKHENYNANHPYLDGERRVAAQYNLCKQSDRRPFAIRCLGGFRDWQSGAGKAEGAPIPGLGLSGESL
jgi:hypothetical protein